MLVTLKYFKSVIELTKIKHEIIKNHGSRAGQIRGLVKAKSKLALIELDDLACQGDIIQCRNGVDIALEYLYEDSNSLEDSVYVRVMQSVLDTYFAPLDIYGSEIDRVTWMETSIYSFIETFGTMSKHNMQDPAFQSLVRGCKGDIDVMYTDTFTPSMKDSVSNYAEFLKTLEKLGIAPETNPVTKVATSSIFN